MIFVLIYFFENTERIESLSNLEFKELLSLPPKESYFIFKGKLYVQVHGVAMIHLQVRQQLMFFLCTWKSTGYKIVHLTLRLVAKGGILFY